MNKEIEERKEIVKYQISKDGVGLLAYFEDGGFYHIHSDELTKLEAWILAMLRKETGITQLPSNKEKG